MIELEALPCQFSFAVNVAKSLPTSNRLSIFGD